VIKAAVNRICPQNFALLFVFCRPARYNLQKLLDSRSSGLVLPHELNEKPNNSSGWVGVTAVAALIK